MTQEVWIVSEPHDDDPMAVFSSYEKAKAYADRMGYHLDSHPFIVDVEPPK